MRLPAPRRRDTRPAAPARLAAVAALTAASLLSGCTGSGHSPDTRDKAAATPSAAPSTPKAKPSPTAGTWDGKGGRPTSVAAVGDSITRGFDACSVLTDCPEVSWVTGTDTRVDSFASRLLPEGAGGSGGGRSANQRGSTVEDSWNLAHSGARMADLPDQVADAVAKKPGMVVVLMGANDACRSSDSAMTPVADFRASFEESLDALKEELPGTRVLVSSVPDLEQLWRVGRRSPMAKQIWRLGICPSMLSRPDSTDAADRNRRTRVSAQVDAYNEVLKSSCAKYPACRYDGGAVHGYRFTTDDLSPWDWFHPSVRGQAKLARIVYEAAFGRD